VVITALYDGTVWQVIAPASGAVTSLTTTGTSGAATLSGGVLNIPQYSGGGGGTIPTSGWTGRKSPFWNDSLSTNLNVYFRRKTTDEIQALTHRHG